MPFGKIPTREGFGLYGRSAVSAAIAKAALYASAFGSLWLLTRFLPVGGYGAYAFSIALVWFLSVPAGLGLEQSAMIRVARGGGSQAKSPVAIALVCALVIGSIIAASLVVLAPEIAGWTNLPDLERWLAGLAPVVPLLAIASVFEHWFLALGRVGRAQLFPAMAHVTRLTLLAIALPLASGAATVILVELVASALPVLAFALSALSLKVGRPAPPSGDDLRAGGALMLARAASDGARRIDIFLLGVLSSAAAVGEYAVAARLVVAVDLGREMFQPAFTSRAGRTLRDADKAATRDEYDRMRAAALIVGLAVATGVAALGKPVLSLFGAFESAYPVLMLLAAGAFVNVAFGANHHLLKLAGHAGPVLRIRLLMLAVVIATNLLLIPRFGAVGAAAAAFSAIAAANVLFMIVLWRRERIATLNGPATCVTLVGAAILIGAAAGAPPLLCAAGLVLAGIAYAAAEPRSWRPVWIRLARLAPGR